MANSKDNSFLPSLRILTRGLLGLFVCLLFCSFAKADIRDGFIHGYWFENNTADVMNTSNGYNANGTFDSGFIGESIYFSNSAYVRLENSNNTDFGIAAGKDGKMTIMCWYYPTQSTTSARVLISNEDWYKGLNPGVTIDAQYLTGPDFNFGDGVQAHRCEYVAKKTVANKWQFVAVSADIQAGTADLYYGTADGNLQLLNTMNISNLDSFLSSYKWYLATDYSNYDYYFRGYMDEVAFWNRALTQAEVTSIFNNQKAGTGLGVQLARAAGGSVTQGDGTWDTDTNWSYRGIPDSQTDVFINHSITDSSDRTINANMTINNDGTYTSSGTLKLGDGENLTGTLILNGGTASVDGLVLSSNSGVNISAGTLNIDSSSTLYNLSGGSLGENDQIAVPGHLIVNGKLTLDNDAMSKFIGSISAETIEKTGDGTLQLYSSAANMISAESLVISSGRLDMKEYFKGSLTVGEKLEGDDNYSIATFSPGNSVGTLTIDGSDLAEGVYAFTLNPESTLLMELGGETAAENDMLIVNGSFTIADDAIIYLALADENSFTTGDSFEAQIQAGTASDDYVNAITKAIVPGWPFSNLSVTKSGNVYSIRGTYDPNAVPEPSTWALMILGVAGLLYVRKRNRK